jgi:hypothetical protein
VALIGIVNMNMHVPTFALITSCNPQAENTCRYARFQTEINKRTKVCLVRK